MRWIWIDRFEKFKVNVAATAIKNVSLAEEHLHDHFPGFPVMPASLMIEGMAQTAGILVGAARNFQEKVILAKINKATFTRLVRPGEQLVYAAKIVNVTEQGAAIEGIITARPPHPTNNTELPVATIDMMFSHIDNNMSGTKFPEFNFVFNSQFMELFETYRRELEVKLP
ncbi:MAG: beta-hydroxyacyl-ACP dehydratase [Phycisphaerales bacterium]|nr:beta-hydroxyacyl-ACP dehydratase [Phycisphaerales bacterium]